MKKIIGIFMALVMMLTSLNLAAAAADSSASDNSAVSDRYIELFSSLGVFSKTYNRTDSITRAQYAQMLTRLLGYEYRLSSMRGVAYSDVAVDYTFSKEINLMNVLGIMIAKEGDKFCPEDKLTMDDAVASMVRALGYTTVAEKSGGAPDGYNKVADMLGIRKGISSKLMTPYAAAGAVARLFYNSLDVEILSYTNGMTIFKDYLELERGTGQVTAVYGMSLIDGTVLENGEIMIGDRSFETSLTSLMSYFGCTVEYYCHEDKNTGNYTLTYVRPLKKSEEVTVYSADIEDFEDNRLYYSEEGKRNYSTLRISSDAIVLYNGRTVASLESKYIPKNGYIKCISTEGGQPYNVVIIFDYQSFVVDSVFNGGISFKYGNAFKSTNGNSYTTLNLSSDNSIIERDGNYIQPEAISKNEVVSVAFSGKTYYITVSKETVKGVIRQIDSESMTVRINSDEYVVDETFAKLVDGGAEGTRPFASNLNATFYLDLANRIVGMTVASSDMRYGYLKTVDDEAYTVKIYDINEREFVKFNIDKNCKLNGEKKTQEYIATALLEYRNECNSKTRYDSNDTITDLVPPIIKFRTNEDFDLSAIVTTTYTLAPAGQAPSAGQVGRDVAPSDDFIILSAPYGKKIWDFSYNIFTSYQSDVGNVRAAGFPGMQLPTDGNEEDFDASTAVQSIMPKTDNLGYSVIIYDIDFETGTPGFVIYVAEAGGTKVEIKNQLYGVGSVSDAVDENDENCMCLELYPASTAIETTMYTTGDDRVVEACRNLNKGDIVQIKTNYKGVITAVTKVISYSKPDDYTTATYTSSNGEQFKRHDDGTVMFFSKYVSSKYITNGNIGTIAKFAVNDTKSGTPFLQTITGKGLIYDGSHFYRGDSDNIARDDWVFGIGFIEKCSNYVIFKYNRQQYSDNDQFMSTK